MTPAEQQKLLDEAVTLLKGTTVGWAGHSAAWQANQTTRWWQALDRIRRVRESLGEPPVPPPPVPASVYLNNLGDFGRPAKDWNVASNWHPDSARLVGFLTDNMKLSGRTSIATGGYGVVLVRAKPSDPLVYITDIRGWGTLPPGKLGPLRCPSAGDAAVGTDGHMVIVQPDSSIWEMWRGKRQPDGGFTSEATCFGTPGQWNYPRASCRGSSFTLASGAIAPEEVTAGIKHALLCVMDDSIIKRGAVPPATGSDGEQADGVQEGMRFVLDPTVTVTGTALAKAVGRALQTHGMILGDRTSQPELSFIGFDPQTWTAFGQPDPWKALGYPQYPNVNELIPLLSRLRVERF